MHCALTPKPYRIVQTGLLVLLICLASCSGEPSQQPESGAASAEVTATVDQALQAVSGLETERSSADVRAPGSSVATGSGEQVADSAQPIGNAAELEQILERAGRLRDDGRFLEAENLYQQYFDSRGYVDARPIEQYGHLLSRTGQFNEAIGMFNRARQVEPMSPHLTRLVALHELYRGQYAQVRRLIDYGLGLEGAGFPFRALQWELAMRSGELDRAARLIRGNVEDAVEWYDDGVVSRQFLEKFADILELNDFEASAGDIAAMINAPSVTPVELGYLARLVAVLGQPGIALEYWFGQPASPVIWDEVFDEMRRLPDFNRLLQEKGMVDYWRATGSWGDFCVAAGGRDFVCD